MAARRLSRLLALALGLGCLTPGAAAAQRFADSRWLPWLGCWAPVSQAEPEAGGGAFGEVASAPRVASLLCVEPAPEGVGVVIATVRDGQEVQRRTLIADGARRDVEMGGCSGWETAQWSADGGRVFYRSELTCEGGVRRASSGATMMLESGDWLDAEVVRAGDARALEVRRYRFATAEEHRAHGREPPAGDELALETARKAAAAVLSISDVIEAASLVDEQVVQALLAEYGGRFPLDARALERMAAAGVSPQTIDLVVALSFPDRFVIDRTALAAGFRPPEPPAEPAVRDALADTDFPSTHVGAYGYSRGCSAFFSPWRIGFYPDPYSLPYGYPYTRGYGYGDCGYWSRPYYRPWIGSGTAPVVTVERKPDAGGRAVPGGGYTRANRDDSKGRAVPRAGRSGDDGPRRSVVSSPGGRATRTGYKAPAGTEKKDSNGGSGRKAKPRSGGG